MKLPPPQKKTIDLEGRLIKDGVRKAIRDRQNALHELLNAINQYRKVSESKPSTLQGSSRNAKHSYAIALIWNVESL
jgi:hypothetical protein